MISKAIQLLLTLWNKSSESYQSRFIPLLILNYHTRQKLRLALCRSSDKKTWENWKDSSSPSYFSSQLCLFQLLSDCNLVRDAKPEWCYSSFPMLLNHRNCEPVNWFCCFKPLNLGWMQKWKSKTNVCCKNSCLALCLWHASSLAWSQISVSSCRPLNIDAH